MLETYYHFQSLMPSLSGHRGGGCQRQSEFTTYYLTRNLIFVFWYVFKMPWQLTKHTCLLR